ncbi:MAG: hypothetical protein IKR79_03085 [Bacteroidales bacterium]|nr:hypothetical protein [Bacteroidales bacterium]
MLGVALMALLLASCSTQKAKWANITYHNTTCHYNTWWNGNESYRIGLKKLGKTFADDYTQILPVYQIGSKEKAMAIYPEMDKAIEKGIKGIKKHSIYVQGREYVKYVKNCYLLTAYATFYKQDYAATANTCRLIISQYGGSSESDEARILLARCLTQEKQYSDAESALDLLVNDQEKDNFSPKLTDKLYMAMIECVLPQEKYKKSVQYIRLALDETKDRRTKARLYFIMAQIYQKLDKRPTATKYYEKVLKCRPDYVMEFNARINIASCANEERTNLAEVEKSLDKMLKDKKNEEFKDQIYYAKGEMYLGMKDAKKACDNFKQSVAAASGNPAQKAKSALRLADVLYELYENYDEAQIYYDTAMHIIKAGYPHFDEIRSRYNTLTALVENTRLIYRNDSLLLWADMDPGERSKLIDKKIADLRQKEKEEAERQLIAELNQEATAQQNTLQGDWYFYNHNTVSKGKQTFRQRWGVRTLDDYWFLSNRSTFAMGSMIPGMEPSGDDWNEQSDSTLADSTTTVSPRENPDDPHYAAYYLKDLPKTQGQRDTMHLQIAKCLLNAGYIYYDGIENTERALECYHRLAKDYPDADEIVQAFYQMWRIYSKQGNTPQANYYKDMVLMGFPDCDYANMIRDDQYYLEIIKRSEVAQNEYATVYSLYRRKRYHDVVAHVDQALNLYNEQPLMGKFKYWKGLASAQYGDTNTATATFESIIADYDDTTRLVVLAKEQLAYLRTGYYGSNDENISSDDEAKGKKRYNENVRDVASSSTNTETASQGQKEELPTESLMYRYKENMQHYVAVLIDDRKIVATQLQYAIADFNMQNYSNSGYRASPLLFTDTVQMLTIHRFKDAKEAEDYRTHLLLDGGPMSKYDPKDYVVFSISTQNYNTFYNQKNIEAYRKFYEYYYSEK